MAILEKTGFYDLPECKIIGLEVLNGGGQNPVPALWARIFRERLLDALPTESTLFDFYIGWMADYNPQNDTFTYIAGYLLPTGTPVPEGFSARTLEPCQIAIGAITGDISDGTVFACAHKMTVAGIEGAGRKPDYTKGWSAEAYAKDLDFGAKEGTIHYICPCE